jgi:hypothetical protein
LENNISFEGLFKIMEKGFLKPLWPIHFLNDDVMRLFQILAFLAISSFIFSCKNDLDTEPIIVENAFPSVEIALQPYFEEFEFQASLRGITVDLAAEKIIGKIEELPTEHVAGQCTYGSAIDNEIIIDQTFWNDFPQTLVREMVIFHELGHCFLHRGHTEGAHPNGTCLSIMRSGLEDCQDNYNAQTRAAYLNELFSGFQ